MRLEELLGYPVITYYTAEEGRIEDVQSLHLFEHLRRLGRQERLGLWINSRGGITETPWKIVSLMREFADEWTALIPYKAHSSATLVVLGANELVMTEMSELGPVDPSRSHPLLPRVEGPNKEKQQLSISVQDLRHVLSFLEREIGKEQMSPEAAATVYTALFEHVHPLAIGALEQSWALAEQVCRKVLSTHVTDEELIDELVKHFTDGYASHSYQISRSEAKLLGLNVRDATDAESEVMWDVYVRYSQGIQIAGEARVNNKPADLTAVGYIGSRAGTSIGVMLTDRSDPRQQPRRWESKWLLEPRSGAKDEIVSPPGTESTDR